MPDASTPTAEQPPELIAESYPPLPAVEPVRARRIHWLLALPAALAALVLPRRMGPHLAASSWTAAYVAHFLSIVLFWGTVWAFIWETQHSARSGGGLVTPSLSLSEHVRQPLAGFVVFCYMVLESWPAVIGAVLGTAVFELALWLAAVALIPWYAAGERRVAVFLRSVKLLLWSTAFLIPLGYAIPALVRWLEDVNTWVFRETAAFCVPFVWTAWWMSVLLRLGGRYGGPKVGPGWEPRALRCEYCSYELTMSPIGGRCPECGKLVADSLRERRRLPAFAAARGLFGWVGGYPKTAWRSLFARRFARAICVRQGHRAARQFAFLTCVLIGLLGALASIPYVIEILDEFRSPHEGWYDDPVEWVRSGWPWLALVEVIMLTGACIAGLICLGWLLVAGMFVTLFGFRDAIRRSIVLCYSSAWLVLPTVFGIAGVWLTIWANDVFLLTSSVRVPLFGLIDKILIVGTVLLLPAIASFLLWFFHLRRMLRETRYANS